MTRKRRLTSSDLKSAPPAGVRGAKNRAKSASPRKRKVRGKRSLLEAAEGSKRRSLSLEGIAEFYRPLKKPITLRLDADVLAWFKKDGTHYQTRINSALRKIMEREMKDAGW